MYMQLSGLNASYIQSLIDLSLSPVLLRRGKRNNLVRNHCVLSCPLIHFYFTTPIVRRSKPPGAPGDNQRPGGRACAKLFIIQTMYRKEGYYSSVFFFLFLMNDLTRHYVTPGFDPHTMKTGTLILKL